MKSPLNSHSARVLLALAVGLVAGSLISAKPTPLLLDIVSWIEPVGTLWINALRMVVVPLVVSMLIAGVASIADVGTVRRIGGITFGVWLSLLLVSGLLGFTLVPLLFSGLTIDPAATAALRESASSLAEGTTAGLERMPSLQQWFTDLVPTNPVRAAADGAMLPLVIFRSHSVWRSRAFAPIAERHCCACSTAPQKRCSSSCAGCSRSPPSACSRCRWASHRA